MFALLGFSLILTYYFVIMLSFTHFGKIMYILYHHMVEVHNLFFDFTGVAIKRLPQKSQKKLWTALRLLKTWGFWKLD